MLTYPPVQHVLFAREKFSQRVFVDALLLCVEPGTIYRIARRNRLVLIALQRARSDRQLRARKTKRRGGRAASVVQGPRRTYQHELSRGTPHAIRADDQIRL